MADSIAALPKVYTHEELWRKYPGISFENPPPQTFAADYVFEKDTLENSRISFLILDDTLPDLQLSSDTVEGTNLVLQSIDFSGPNCFMRILIQNKSAGDYLVGPMNLLWFQDSGKAYPLYPCFITAKPSYGFITSYPPLAKGVEKTIVLVTRAVNMKDTERILLSIGDRLNNINLELIIPGTLYNKKMSEARF